MKYELRKFKVSGEMLIKNSCGFACVGIGKAQAYGCIGQYVNCDEEIIDNNLFESETEIITEWEA